MFKILTIVILSCMMSLAQAWPTKDITLISPYPPGGATDQMARILQYDIAKSLGVKVIVLNLPGAQNMSAINRMLSVDNDNHTFVLSLPDFITGPMHLKKDLVDQFTAVTIIGSNPLVIFGNKASSVDEIKEQIKNKQVVSIGSTGATGIGGMWIRQLNGININGISFKGTPQLLTDVMGKHVDYGVIGVNGIYNQFQGNTLTPLLVSSKKRMAVLPDVPTYTEVGITGHSAVLWYAVFARSNTDPAVMEKMSMLIRQVVDTNAIFQDYKNKGLEILNLNLKDSNDFYQDQAQFYESQIKKEK